MEMTGGEDRDRGTRMAMRFKIPSPLLEATRRNVDSSTVILNPSSLDNLHLVKQAQAISGRINPDPDQDSDDPDPDPLPPPGFASAAAANTSVHPPPPPPPQGLNVIYKECLKNHAANIGGHVVDGCGEFMPGGGGGGGGEDDGGSETALKCAACNCHRNFHRKEIDGCEASGGYNYPYNSARIINPPQIPTNQAPPPPISGHHRYQHHNYPVGPPMPPARMMAFGGGGGGAGGESSSEDLNMLQYSSGGGGGGGQFMMSHQQQQQQPISRNYSPSKKRFRTKFTAEQKEKMHELAEHLGWKIQKQSEELVKKFCNEYGVKRQVFKVWMHNNKQAIKHKHNPQITIS